MKHSASSRTPDDLLDNALAVLRKSDPSSDFQNRVMQRLACRLAEQHHVPSTSLGWRKWLLPAALGFTTACTFALLKLRRHDPAGTLPPATHPVLTEGPRTRPAIAPPLAFATRHPVLHAASRKQQFNSAAPVSLEALAQEETDALTRPTPELPLTEQEKLMLRIIHSHDPVLLAQLDPASRAARLRQDQQEVQRFFHPHPPTNTIGDQP